MGNNGYNGIHRGIALRMKRKYNLDTLIETGTFQGDSALWARNEGFFVHTIESDKSRIESLKEKFADEYNTKFHPGDSAVVLKDVLAVVDKPALIFLDAHAPHDSGATPPVMLEIEAIKNCDVKHIVMVDDVWLFGAVDTWPTLEEVISALEETGRMVYTLEDVIVGEYAAS